MHMLRLLICCKYTSTSNSPLNCLVKILAVSASFLKQDYCSRVAKLPNSSFGQEAAPSDQHHVHPWTDTNQMEQP